MDNTLYLWNYFKPEEFDVYDGLTEAIISVALSVPKAGIFQESVKYVLALATPVEVVLLALCNVNKDGQLKLVPTAYSLPSDNVTMLKIVGSLSGRIFMAGNDGNIYELDYSYTDNSWAALVGGVPQHKCRKINHFAWQWRLVNLMPPFLRSLVEMEDTLAEVIVDNLRNVMYAITSHGVLSAFYLGVNGDETQYFGKGFHVLEAARSYLSGRGYAESSPKVDTFKDLNAPGFQVVGLFPVPVTESKRVHLVVVLANGLRIYLSLLAGHMQYNRIAVSPADAVPSGLEVVHVRSPPGLSTIASCSAAPSREDGDVDAGALPSLLPSTVLHSSCAYYSHGLFMLVVEKAHAPDELVMVFEDHGQRSNASGALPTNTSLPCLREGVSVGLDARNNTGKIYAIKESTAPFLNETYATLRSLHTHSATPPNNSMVRDTSQFVPSSCSSGAGGGVLGKLTGWFDSSPGGAASAEKAVPCSYTNDLRTTSAGYDVGNLDKLIITNELFDEHLPASTCFTQRQVLVLTNQGIHVFKKIRPTDVLYRQLTSSRSDDAIKRVYGFFGLQQACVMSLALCLGLPRDAGGAPLIDNAFALMSSVLPIDNVQLRAMSSMLSLSSPAAYRALAPPTGAVALHDSRLVVSGSNYEFFKSTAHDSLYAVIARVLRPIWFRPVVSKSNLSIPFWWKGDVINELRRPLVIMTDLMRSYFSAAIMGNYSKPEHSAFGNNLMTQQIAARAAQQQATEKMLQLQAKTLEDASLQAFYLLVARSLHALSFIDILRTLLERKAVQVSLVDLAEITFRSLVVLPKVHSSVKKILHEVIQGLAKGDPLVADEVISCLNRDCYHFFSAGDRYSYEAFRLVDAVTRRQALNETNLQGMKEVDSMSSKCVDNFIRASSSWQSVEDVVGERSDLLQACTAMQSLGPLGYNGIVDIALKVADAFKSISAESTLPGSPMRGQQGSAPWDASFFHGGSVLTKEDANLAVQAAYKCLVQQISYVGVKAGHAAQLAMVQRAVANSDDVVFHEMLYGRLVDEAQQVLLDVSSPYVEQYLRGNHPLVLFQYYDHIGAHGKASALMSALATDEQDVPIADRLHYLRSALSSAEQASPTSAAERLLMHQSATELRDALDVADYQLMANERLVADFNSYGYEGAGRAKYSDAQRRHLDVMAEHVHKLGYRLLDVNTLFHEMCLRYRQWDICIMLIHVCGIQDADLLARLWRSFIYRCGHVPFVLVCICVFLPSCHHY